MLSRKKKYLSIYGRKRVIVCTFIPYVVQHVFNRLHGNNTWVENMAENSALILIPRTAVFLVRRNNKAINNALMSRGLFYGENFVFLLCSICVIFIPSRNLLFSQSVEYPCSKKRNKYLLIMYSIFLLWVVYHCCLF